MSSEPIPSPGEAAGKTGLDPRTLVPALITGIVAGTMVVIESVSYGVLIFSGDRLNAFVPAGIAAALIGASVSGLIMSLTSSFPGTISAPQSKISPILAMAAAAVAVSLPATLAPEQVFLTVLAVIAISSLVVGLIMTAMGVFKLGAMIRFIPYPVIAGFLAGTGWLLVLGSFKAMTGKAVNIHELARLIEPAVISKWVPGLAFAVIARVVMSRSKHFLAMPGLLLGAVVIFYAAIFAGDMSLTEAREAGYLLHGAGSGGLFEFRTLAAAKGADWGAVLAQAGSIASILLVASVAILLNSSALELAAEYEMDLDRELKSAGAANLASALLGGMPGFTSLSISGLVVKMGVRSRLAGLLAALGALAVLFFGGGLLGYIPEPVVGGLLLFLGLTFLHEWLIETRHQLPLNEYLIVIIILVVIGLFGFLQGVLLGVVAAIVLFVVKYSRVNVVKHAIAGNRHLSQVDRPPACKAVLRERGESIFILKLHGFIFFGTANGLYTRIKARAADQAQAPLRFVALDFREVSGVDTSAIISLIKMRQLAKKSGFTLILSHLGGYERKLMEQELIKEDDPNLRVFSDIDHALEWAEDQILSGSEAAVCAEEFSLARHLEAMLPEGFDFARFAGYLERREAKAGDYIINQGDESGDMFFLESGRVAVHLKLPNGEILRLRKMGAGNVVGEMGLYLQKKRSASIVVDEDAVLFRLSRDSLAQMEKENPGLASSFHQFMVRMLSQRVLDTDETIKALMA